MLSETQIGTLERRRAQVLSEIASVGEMRAGSLTARFRRCGKAGCHCARPDDPGHGPGAVADAARERQDGHADHSGACGSGHPGADRGTSALPAVVEGAGGGEHDAERSAAGGLCRADRRGGEKGASRNRSRPRSARKSRPSQPRAGRRAGSGGAGASGPAQGARGRRADGGGPAERGPKRSRRPGGALRLRTDGALCRPSREDLPERAGPVAAGTGLVPLRRLPHGVESARPGVGPAGHVAVTRRCADGGVGGGRGQLRRGGRTDGGVGRGADRRQAGRAHRRSPGTRDRPPTNEPSSSRRPAPRRRCIRDWRAPACRCDSPRSKAAAGSSPAARPGPERSSWPSSGPPNRATTRAGPCATPDRSVATPPSRAPPPATPTRSRPRSRSAFAAKRDGAASTPRPGRSSLATAPTGSGIRPTSSFPALSKSSTSTTSGSICPTQPRPPRRRDRGSRCLDPAAASGVGRRAAAQDRGRAANRRREREERRGRRRSPPVRRLPVPQPPPDVLPAVPRPGTVRRLGCRRGPLQAGGRRQAQARGDEMDPRRSRRRRRPPLLQAQRTFRGLLGAESRLIRGISQI